MPFDPEEFAAKVVLGQIPSEAFPAAAQDALEAGFDGPALLRLAILERPSGWEVDQLIAPVFSDLAVARPTVHEAAVTLAKARGRRILDRGEDPLDSIGYFHRLLMVSDYAQELEELGWLEEDCFESIDAMRAAAFEAIENLFDASLRQRRWLGRMSRWEEQRKRALQDWPYKLDSPGGRREYWRRVPERWREVNAEAPWLLPAWVLLVLGMTWMLGTWWIALICFFVLAPVVTLARMLVLWRSMAREVQERRWRERIDV